MQVHQWKCLDAVLENSQVDRALPWLLTLDGGGEVDVGDGNAADAAQVGASPLFLLLLYEPPSLIQ